MAIYKTDHQVQRPPYLGNGQWRIRGLTDVVVVMGKNGSGKSVLLRAWRDQNPDGIHYVIPERTGDLEYQPHFLNEELDGNRRRGASAGNFVSEYRRRIISRVQTYFMIRGNHRGTTPPPGGPEELEQLLSSLVPEFAVQLLVSTPPYSLRRLATNEVINQIAQLSSGEAQLLTIGLDILIIASIWEIEARAERIMLIDEPDAHIHPDLQARFADFLCRVVDRFLLQLVVATHSTSLMSALGQFGATKASVIYIERAREEYVAKRFDEVTKELAACLGGHVLMGPLFGAPILLVEGDDDYRIWSQVPRHHVINLAVLPCNGDEIKKYQRVLETILGGLCEVPARPLGYALLDGDKPVPQANQDNQQRYIRFIGMNCHEAENLYLTDVVLKDLGHTWDTATTVLISEADRFGNKADLLKACRSWDRQQVDIKALIQEIAVVLDPKNVAWAIRIGSAIGRARPSGELEEFLGPMAISALWT